MRIAWFLGCVALGTAGCGGDPAPDVSAPTIDVLEDGNPDPSVVEVSLVAEPATWELLPGKGADVWAFRDVGRPGARATIPGPMLEANLGDRVIVHFENRLAEATTIHWHGIRVPNAADGTPVAQLPIEPGQRYDYEFVVEDAGLFWYHPHMNGDVQVERGLYAPIRIRGGIAPDVAADRVFVLDDVKVESTGALSTTTDDLDIMLGRQGNVQLVNGRLKPVLEAAAATRERWRFVSAANGRYFHLELPGRRFKVIGWDGGMLPEPYDVDTLLIAPGERYDVLVELAGTAGDALELRNAYYDRGHDIPDTGPRTLMTVMLGAVGTPAAPLPERWGNTAALAVDAATPRRPFVLREEVVAGAAPTFSINGEQYPDVTPLAGTTGTIEIWELENLTEMDHPFHLHGMFFQVLDDTGLSVRRLGWKDTVNVPREQTVRVAVALGEPGRWMYHCHILEHAERGMMGELALVAP